MVRQHSLISSAALQFDFRRGKRGGSFPSILELLVSTGHTSSIRKVDGLHGVKGKYTLLSSSVTTALVSIYFSQSTLLTSFPAVMGGFKF